MGSVLAGIGKPPRQRLVIRGPGPDHQVVERHVDQRWQRSVGAKRRPQGAGRVDALQHEHDVRVGHRRRDGQLHAVAAEVQGMIGGETGFAATVGHDRGTEQLGKLLERTPRGLGTPASSGQNHGVRWLDQVSGSLVHQCGVRRDRTGHGETLQVRQRQRR